MFPHTTYISTPMTPTGYQTHFPDASIILGMLKPPAGESNEMKEQTK
jgi:hypothetical protein